MNKISNRQYSCIVRYNVYISSMLKGLHIFDLPHKKVLDFYAVWIKNDKLVKNKMIKFYKAPRLGGATHFDTYIFQID